MRIAAESKMGYYPTHPRETLRLISVFANCYYSSWKIPELSRFLGNKYDEINQRGFYSNWRKENAWMDACFDLDGGIEFAKERFQISFNRSYTGKIVVFDGFAGEGEWLSVWKNILTREDGKNEIFLVGNEIEDNRYKKVKKVCDVAYHGSFEELQFPAESVSITLLNPPYGTNENGKRNALHFLEKTIERNYFLKEKDYYNKYTTGYIICVFSAEDMKLCLPTLVKYFDDKCLYRVEDETEYNRFHQFIYIGKVRETPMLDTWADLIQKTVDRLSKDIDTEEKFKDRYYGLCAKESLPTIDIETKLENFKFKQHETDYLSNSKSLALKWAKDFTRLNVENFGKITMPKPPKSSEISVLISSGIINGEIETEMGKHVVVGGVKIDMEKKEDRKVNEKGEGYTETKFIKTSKPYLNVMYSDKNGKVVIKELT